MPITNGIYNNTLQCSKTHIYARVPKYIWTPCTPSHLYVLFKHPVPDFVPICCNYNLYTSGKALTEFWTVAVLIRVNLAIRL